MSESRKIVGLVELARIAGVSPATVSRALSDSPIVAPATRSRIRALAQEHGLRLNQTASAFRRRKTQAIGVTIPLGHDADQSLTDPFFMGLIGPLADALSRAGYDLLLSRVIPEGENWLEDLVQSGRVDGVIVIGQSNQAEVIERVARTYRPIVVWGERLANAQQITVGADNAAGGRLAARRLLSIGRKRLAFLGNPDAPEFAARLEGFRSEAEAGGACVTLLPVHLSTETAHQEIAAFLDARPLADGLFAASDVIAMSALRAMAERGLAAPQDVAVIGYDDVLIARHTSPPLTTIRQDMAGGARLLVDILLRRMAGEEAGSVTMQPELILRGSA